MRGFHYDLRGEGPSGDADEVTINRLATFSWHEQRLSCRFALAWGLACFAVLATLAWLVAGLFRQTPAVTRDIVLALRILPAGYGMTAVCLLVAVSFQAMNRPLVSAALEGTRLLVLMTPLAWAGMRLAGLPGLLAGIATANIIAGTLAWRWARAAVPPANALTPGATDA